MPFLVVGIEGKVENILRTNPQLSRLFPIRENIQPLEFNPSKENDFVQFVVHAEQVINFRLTKEIHRSELLYRLNYASDGVVGQLMNLLRYAAMLASNEGHDDLDLNTLHRAFERRIANVLSAKVNPFDPDIDGHFEPRDPWPAD